MTVLTLQPDEAAGNDADISVGGGVPAGVRLYPQAAANTFRSLIRFDLSSIPATAVVSAATLTLVADEEGNKANLSLHALTRAWVEAEVNWTEGSTGVNWTSAGGDFEAIAYKTWVNIGIGTHTADLTTLTQKWVSGTLAKNGFLLKYDTEVGAGIYVGIASSNYPVAGSRPKLVITYTLPVGGGNANRTLYIRRGRFPGGRR